ncbi:MAG TPA: response regulator transcription factor [Streptosporangiaceae bacterium]|jgi:two-component system uhpT operon response regulator UhpA
MAEKAELPGNGKADPRVRIAIVDDHHMVLSGLQAWVKAADGIVRVVIAAASWAELLEHPAFPVDVVLLDLDLGDGIPVPLKISTLRQAGVATVVISTLADPARIRACLDAGAAGYLPKSEPADEILRAVTSAAGGQGYMTSSMAALLVADLEDNAESAPALSPQELRALILYASGLPMKSVARRLGVSIYTAKGYIDRVRDKYAHAGREARTKLDLHQRAVEDGLLVSE